MASPDPSTGQSEPPTERRPTAEQVARQQRLGRIMAIAAAAAIAAGIVGWYRGDIVLPGSTTEKMDAKQTMHRVIVTLKGVGAGKEAAAEIAKAQDQLLKDLSAFGIKLERRYDMLPQLTLTVNDKGLDALKAHPGVAGVARDALVAPNDPAKPK
jgi:hypothetical protein